MSALDGKLEPEANIPMATSADCNLISIAISLKRIADIAEQFGNHPDNANYYGETGMRAVIGELTRFKNEAINDFYNLNLAARR